MRVSRATLPKVIILADAQENVMTTKLSLPKAILDESFSISREFHQEKAYGTINNAKNRNITCIEKILITSNNEKTPYLLVMTGQRLRAISGKNLICS